MKNQKTIVDKIFEILLSFSVLGMAFILIAGVFARTVLNSSLSFTEEVGIWLNIAVTFLGKMCIRDRVYGGRYTLP